MFELIYNSILTPTILGHVSKISGILSLSVWLFAQLPQIIENHLNQSVDGVSLSFLLCWIGGDMTNLIGCVLTKALPFQTCLAAYYCFIDCILSLQFWYYTRVYPKQRGVHHNMLQSPNMMRQTPQVFKHATRRNRFQDPARSPVDISRRKRSSRRSGIMHRVLSATVLGSFVKKANAAPVMAMKSKHSEKVSNGYHHLTKVIPFIFALVRNITSEDVGKCFAWACSALYLCSRSPQIYKNYKSGSTHGISVFLFVFAMMGNSFYTISIISDLYLLSLDDLLMVDGVFHKVLFDQLPFIVGSLGTIMFDTVIIFQCWYYSESSDSRQSSVVSEDIQLGEHDHGSFRNKRKRPTTGTSLLHFQKPDWYTNNHVDPRAGAPDQYRPGSTEHLRSGRHSERSIDENTSLLFKQGYIFEATTPPPPHYVSASLKRAPAPMKRGASSTRSQSSEYLTATSPLPLPLPTSLIPSIIGSYSAVSRKMSHEAKIPFSPIDFLSDEFHVPAENSYRTNRMSTEP